MVPAAADTPMTLAALAREAGLPEPALRGTVAEAMLFKLGLRLVRVGPSRVVRADDLSEARRILRELAADLTAVKGEKR